MRVFRGFLASTTLLMGACVANPGATSSPDPESYGEVSFIDSAKADGATHGIRPPDNGPFDFGVALTFDDGPDSGGATDDVIEVLNQYNAPGVFFIHGTNVMRTDVTVSALGRVLFEQWYGAGQFEVANHSWQHANLTRLTNAEIIQSIDQTELVSQVVADEMHSAVQAAEAERSHDSDVAQEDRPAWEHVHAFFDPERVRERWREVSAASVSERPSIRTRMRYFRFPGGNASERTIELVESMGYQTIGWHGGYKDYTLRNRTNGGGARFDRDAFLGGVLSSIGRSDGGVMLGHDRAYDADYPTTDYPSPLSASERLPRNRLDVILEGLVAEGYSFIRLDDARFENLNRGNTGSVCHTDEECRGGLSCFISSPSVLAEAEGVCTKTCETECPGSNTRCEFHPFEENPLLCALR